LDFALQDPAAFHAALAIAASSWASLYGTGSEVEAAYHKFNAVRIINQRIKEGKMPSELTIAAVFLLWGLEVRILEF
jgi:hypothetical protein